MGRHRKAKFERRRIQCEGLKVSRSKSFHLQLAVIKKLVDEASFIGSMQLSSQWSMSYLSEGLIRADCEQVINSEDVLPLFAYSPE